MSNGPSINQEARVNEAQNVSLTPRPDNVRFRPPTSFNPTAPMQFPHAGTYAEWLSTPASHLLQPHPVPVQSPNNMVPINYHGMAFSGQAHLQNPSYYQNNPQNYQSVHSQRRRTRPLNPTHEIPPPGNKKWTSEEDLQLCRAWVHVTEDPSVGVGQKLTTFWERIRVLMSELMEKHYGKTSTRNYGGCQNRMNEIKLACGKWSAIQAEAFRYPSSGSSLSDSEALARQMWEDENDGKPFKFTACWEVLKNCPRWIQYIEKNVDKRTGPTSQARAGAAPVPQDIRIPEPVHVHTDSNMDQSQTPVTPGTEERTGRTNVTDGEAVCSPVLNGPASIDIVHPPGNKISKTKKARKNKKFSEAQEAACQNFKAGIASLQASTNDRWEKLKEDQHRRDESNKQVLLEERRMMADHHGLDMALKRAEIVEKIASFGRQLKDAIKTAESFPIESAVTPSQKRLYDVSQQTVALYERLLAEMVRELDKTEPKSSSRMDTMFSNPTVGISQRHFDYEDDEDVIVLGND